MLFVLVTVFVGAFGGVEIPAYEASGGKAVLEDASLGRILEIGVAQDVHERRVRVGES